MKSTFFNWAVSSIMCAAMPAWANPAERSAVIDDPAWVLHLDVDALRKSAVGSQILAEMRKPEAELRFAVLKAALGSDPRTGLHGITIYSASPKAEDGVALLYADLNPERLLALAKQFEDYQATSHGAHPIHSWIDAKRREKEGGQPRTFSAIYKDRMLIFAQQQDRLTQALDVLDKTKPSLAKASALPELGTGNPEIIQAAARQIDVPGNDPRAVIIRQSKAINLHVRESDRTLLGNLSLETQNEQTAQQVANIARGIIAILGLQQDNPDAVKLAQGLSVEQTGASATVNLKLSAEDVVAAIKVRAAMNKE